VWARRLSLVVLGLALALAAAELGLRVVAEQRRHVIGQSVSDAVLEMRVPAGAHGHDQRGFRNDRVPACAEIVALGDSQTWGMNVARERAWPLQLARLSGRSVYNMGRGGYGPVQYYVLTSEALALSPRLLVIGFYLGNDIYDAYRTTYGLAAHRAFRSSGAPPGFARDTISEQSRVLLEEERRHSNSFGAWPPPLWPLWLRGHTAVGRLVDDYLAQRTRMPGAWHYAERSWALAHPEAGAVWDGQAPTVLRTAYRLLALDLDERRISEGLRISQELLARIDAVSKPAGVRTLVLLLPTKETVYARLVAQRRGLPPTYQRLIAMELRVRADIAAFLEVKGIPLVDALPALREATEQGRPVFPATTDGHLTANGYLVIASLVNQSLAGFLDSGGCGGRRSVRRGVPAARSTRGFVVASRSRTQLPVFSR